MIIVNMAGVLIIAIIVWWFWLYKPKPVSVSHSHTVIVVDNGVYTPSRLTIAANKATSLEFLRKDSSPCAAIVNFHGLDLGMELPLNKPQQILLPAMKPGVYVFTCQMQMYRGELVVDEF